MVIPGKLFSRARLAVRVVLVGLVILGLILPPGWSFSTVTPVLAATLEQRNTYISLDRSTLNLMALRSSANQPILQTGDTIGVILKTTPNQGAETSMAGYMTFYVPVGTQVVGAEYLRTTNTGSLAPAYIKGAGIAPLGAGPVKPASTPALVGLRLGNNLNGVSELTVDATGKHRGTIAGVYADTGIFYSTDPRTAYNSWVSGGGLDGNPSTTDNALKNTSGATVTPITRWDAEQLLAFGVDKPFDAMLDRDGRGNTPWGVGSAVAGPQSGYAWDFNRTVYQTTLNLKSSVSQTGPWKRIRYNGSQSAKDQAGSTSTLLGYAGVDASRSGVALTAATPLPATTSWGDAASPKAIRFAYGLMEIGRPEYARVWLKITSDTGCFTFYSDAFNGDGGGEQGGKDHLWRFYNPTTASFNTCQGLQKVADKTYVQPGDTVTYRITYINTSDTQSQSNLVITDALPRGLNYVSAAPAPNSTAPLTWNVGSLPANGFWEAQVTVQMGTQSGDIFNTASAASSIGTVAAIETTHNRAVAVLNGQKVSSVQSAMPGSNIQYIITLTNNGSGANQLPLIITEYLPPGFQYQSIDSMYINGGILPVSAVTVNASNPNRPVFTIKQSIQPRKQLVILINVYIPVGTPSGIYDNYFSYVTKDRILAIAPQAPVNVGNAGIGDLIFRDWNGNGIQDPSDEGFSPEEGLPGVTVQLWNSTGTTLLQTAITDASGAYFFSSLGPGMYIVRAPAGGAGGVPAGYVLSADPDSVVDSQHTVALVMGQQYRQADFGYHPTGPGSITGTVWRDDGAGGGGVMGDGLQNGSESGIANVTVWLYEDTLGDGILDADDQLVGLTQSDASGSYTFTNLPANGQNYIVRMNTSDPDYLAAFSSGVGVLTSSTLLQYALQLSADFTNASGLDFGAYRTPPATISGLIFNDTNADGVFNASDTALGFVEVNLYLDINTNGLLDSGDPLAANVQSDASGIYQFTDQPADNYIVDVNQGDLDIPGGLHPANDLILVTVESGETRNDVHFPFVRLLTKWVANLTTGQNPGTDAVPGQTLDYTLTPTYVRPELLTSAHITDTIPAGTTYVPGSANAGGVYSGGQIDWSLGSNTPAADGVIVFCPIIKTVYADADTWVNQSANNKIYGGDNSLRARDDSASADRVPLLHFPIDSGTIEAGSIIQSVTLNAAIQSGAGVGRALNVYNLNTAFVQGAGNGLNCNGTQDGATWQRPDCMTPSSFWASGNTVTGFSSADMGSLLGSLPANSTGMKQMASTAFTQLVKDWITAAQANNGLAMLPNVTDTNLEVRSLETSAGTADDAFVVISYLRPEIGSCSTLFTSGTLVWSPNNTQLQQNIFNSSTNSFVGAVNAYSIASRPLISLAGAASPTRNEMIQVAVDNNRNVLGRLYNGATWTNMSPNPLGLVSNSSFSAAAVAYEHLSGDALVVWDSNNIAPKLLFSTWDGSLWAGPAGVTAYSGAEPLYMKMAASPTSDQAVLVITDANQDDYALVWDGDAWGNLIALDTSGSAVDDQTGIQVVYESLSGRAMIAYAKNNDPRIYYRFWDGAAWSAETSLAPASGVTSQPRWIALAADPNTNRIALAVSTTKNVLWTRMWSGSAWSSALIATTGISRINSPAFSIAFESLSGEAMLAYGRGHEVRYRTWSSLTGWSGELSTIKVGGIVTTITLSPDPNSNKMIGTVLDDNSDLTSGLWSGSAWVSSTLHTNNTGKKEGQPFLYLWNQNAVTQPGTKVSLSVSPALVADGADFTVLVTLESARTIQITSLPLSITGANGASAVCSGPLPALPVSLSAAAPQTFVWNCTAASGTIPGSLDFQATPTGTGEGATFTTATANSLLVTPLLRFRVTVDTPTVVAQVVNTGYIYDASGTLDPTASNTVITDLPRGSIGDTVFYDYNIDGVQGDGNPLNGNEGEPGVPDVTLTLYQDVNNNGMWDKGLDVMTAVTATDAAGNYRFDYIAPGAYVVETCSQCVVNPVTPGLYNMVPSAGSTRAVVIPASGGQWMDADFGYIERALVEGQVFYDENYSGVKDLSETGLAGVTIHLVGADLANNPVNLTLDTAADGSYRFILLPGQYQVTFDQADTAQYPALTTQAAYDVTLAAGNEATHLDFGVDYSGKIGDFIWSDANNNAIKDAPENGLGGATIYLYDGAGVNLLDVTASEGDGSYLFQGLPDGNYRVVVNASSLPGYIQTYDWDGLATANTIQVSVGPGYNNRFEDRADFAYFLPGARTVSGMVWQDANQDGLVSGGEAGVANVAVDLYAPGPDAALNTGDDVFIATATTTITGGYALLGVMSGVQYRLVVESASLPSLAYINTSDPDSPVPGGDSQAVFLLGGSDLADQNFGFAVRFAGLSGAVCSGNGNGDCGKAGDPPEPPQPGLTITALYAGMDGVFSTADDQTFTTATDSSGAYSFTNMAPGWYRITKINPVWAVSRADSDGSDPNNITVQVAPLENRTNLDFELETSPTSVVLSDFSITPAAHQVRLDWSTLSETDLYGFNLYRQVGTGERLRLNSEMIPAQFGGRLLGGAYTYTDQLLPGQTVTYWLELIDTSGSPGQVSLTITGQVLFIPVVRK